MKQTLIFLQFSDKLLTQEPVMRNYYRRAYSKMEGYCFPEHFMEIPYWIPTIAGMLPNDRYQKELHIVENLYASLQYLAKKNPKCTVLCSVMHANHKYVHRLAERTVQNVVVGGYTNPGAFSSYPKVTYLKGIQQLPEVFERVRLGAPPDYSLFAGQECIPRLTLSTGCLFRCTFCTVPTTLRILSRKNIKTQVEAFKPLHFKLVFMDDKSFGQAKNWQFVDDVRRQVESYNPQFRGYIIQTTPILGLREGFLERCIQLGIKYVELGCETLNDEYLAIFRKPHRVGHLEALCDKARSLRMKIIPNLILGIPGDDYQATIQWIAKNRDIIPVVNINFLSVHYGENRGPLSVRAKTVEDRDQNTLVKSWLTEADIQRTREAVEVIHQITAPQE